MLSQMAQGHSNAGICEQLVLSPRTVEAHVGHIFAKLNLTESADYHRRVRAADYLATKSDQSHLCVIDQDDELLAVATTKQRRQRTGRGT